MTADVTLLYARFNELHAEALHASGERYAELLDEMDSIVDTMRRRAR